MYILQKMESISKRRRRDETKLNLPMPIWEQIGKYNPTDLYTEPLTKGSGKLREKYWLSSCFGNPPRIAKRGPSRLICDNHPLIKPQQLSGPHSLPCCLPFKIETLDEANAVWDFHHLLKDAQKILAIPPKIAYYVSTREKWLEAVADPNVYKVELRYYSKEAGLRNYAIYIRSNETNILESSYPILASDNMAWSIASDILDDSEIEKESRFDIKKAAWNTTPKNREWMQSWEMASKGDIDWLKDLAEKSGRNLLKWPLGRWGREGTYLG